MSQYSKSNPNTILLMETKKDSLCFDNSIPINNSMDIDSVSLKTSLHNLYKNPNHAKLELHPQLKKPANSSWQEKENDGISSLTERLPIYSQELQDDSSISNCEWTCNDNSFQYPSIPIGDWPHLLHNTCPTEGNYILDKVTELGSSRPLRSTAKPKSESNLRSKWTNPKASTDRSHNHTNQTPLGIHKNGYQSSRCKLPKLLEQEVALLLSPADKKTICLRETV